MLDKKKSTTLRTQARLTMHLIALVIPEKRYRYIVLQRGHLTFFHIVGINKVHRLVQIIISKVAADDFLDSNAWR